MTKKRLSGLKVKYPSLNLVELEDMRLSQTVTCRELKEIASYIQWVQEKRLLMYFLNRNCVQASLAQLDP